jgi:cysteine desulfurase
MIVGPLHEGASVAEQPAEGDTVYLDYNATAPLRPEALQATVVALQNVGNASSIHPAGREASIRVDLARRQLAGLLNCSASEIIFTSGATEANNLALRAACARGGVLVTTAVEHLAVLETARAITQDTPDALVILPVDAEGVVDLAKLNKVLEDPAGRGVALVSVMLANNETGVLTDLHPIVEAAHAAGTLVHTDATQYVGRLPLDLEQLDVDLLSLSAHKFGGPQGVGALFLRRGTSLPYHPLLIGGGQERGWRAGTLNVAGIVGLGAAAEASQHKMQEEAVRIAKLRDDLEAHLLAHMPNCRINGANAPRLPGVTSVTLPGLPADAVLAAMPQVAASDGSACSSGAPSPSHVLLAMGHSRDDADSTVRFSLGYATTPRDIERGTEAITAAVAHVRSVITSDTEP